MDLNLADKTALITGSTAGIGFAIASSLAKEGASVIVNGRTQKRVNDAIARIQQENSNAKVSGVATDLSTAEGATELTKTFAEVDILINNLGFYQPKAFSDISDEDWLKIFEVNVLSGARLSRFYLPKMLQKNWGRIIFISSESGVNIPVEAD